MFKFKRKKDPVTEIVLDPSPTIHDIGSKYKFSDKAYSKKDRGSRDQDVEVIDRCKETGKTYHFIWNRGVSNDNLLDPFVREHKKGFTFYYARLAYYDEFLIKCPELAFCDKCNTAIIGQVIRENNDLKDYSKFIIMEIKYELDKIRIISAYERDIGFPRIRPYIDNFVLRTRKESVRKDATFENAVLCNNEGLFDILEPGHIAKANQEYFRRRKLL